MEKIEYFLIPPLKMNNFLYFVQTVGLFWEIYFGLSLIDISIVLLKESCVLKPSLCSMFYFWCDTVGYFRIRELDRLTFLGAKIRTRSILDCKMYIIFTLNDILNKYF